MCWAGGRKGKGRGGGGGGSSGGRGVRGVDYGLGIGYTPESSNSSPSPVSNRSATVNSLRTGMMAQFKSSFVAASSNSQNQSFSNNNISVPANKRPTLRGFVSGGSIGGDISTNQTAASSGPASSAGNAASQNSGASAGQKNTDRLLF